MSWTKPFSELSKDDAAIAGGKGASLGEMTQSGIPVPPGFVILSGAFEHFLEETSLLAEIDTILHSVNQAEMGTVENASEKIQALILNAQMPEDIAREIQKHFQELDASYVAVRSSATAEDSASAAWAGQLDSFLNTTEETLLANVQHCWASLFTPRAIFYRFENMLHTTKISVAVVVQKMVQSEVSGIAFSVHPVTEDYNQLIIEAGFGLGEAIVSGAITPDSFVVEKNPRQIVEKNITYQSRALWRGDIDGNEWRELSEVEGNKPALSDAQVLELAEIILRIEAHYGFPCDIEWAFEAGTFYIVQSRPITTLAPKPEVDVNNGGVRILEKKEPMHDTLVSLGLFDKELWNEEGQWMQPPLCCTPLLHWDASPLVRRVVPGASFGSPFNLSGYAFLPKKDRKIAVEFLKERYKEGTLGALAEQLDREGEASLQKMEEWYARGDAYIRGHLGEFFASYEEWCAFWMIEAWLGDQIIPVGKESGYISTEAELFGKVGPHLRKTWIEKEAATVRKIAEEYLADKDEAALKEKLGRYIEEYRWVKFSKWLGEPIDEAYARERLAEEIKNVQEGNYIEPHHSSEEPDGVVALSACTAYWRAEGGRTEMRTAMRMQPILRALGKEVGLSYEQMLLLSPQELIRVARNPKSIELSDILKREGGFFNTLAENGEEIVLSHEHPEYRKLKETHLSKGENPTGNELKGIGASPGKVTAKVRIILSMKDAHTFEDGEILVSPETTPSFVPLMRKASAILTGRGGITSHAAIVSRELKKPCIIAIKDIVKILKTGDVVEVDAENGIVRIIKHAQHS